MQPKRISISCYYVNVDHILVMRNPKHNSTQHKKLRSMRMFECYKDISSINLKLSLLGTKLNLNLV